MDDISERAALSVWQTFADDVLVAMTPDEFHEHTVGWDLGDDQADEAWAHFDRLRSELAGE